MQPKTPWWLVGLGLASLLLSIVALAAATMIWIDGQVHHMEAEDRPQVISAGELEASARVRFPSGTVVLTAIATRSRARAHFSSAAPKRGLEHRIWGKVRMPRAVLDQFVADSGLPPLRPGERALSDESLPESTTWQPDSARTVSGVSEGSSQQPGIRSVLVDLDHPVDVTVYLYVLDA